MGLMAYLNLLHGIAYRQFMYLFVLSVNPFIFTFFEWRHYFIFGIGLVLSLFSQRAIMPFMLLMLLDFDYSKLDKELKKKMLYLFLFGFLIFCLAGGGW